MDKQQSIPITIPNARSPSVPSSRCTTVQYSSCLTKLYGISPDIKVSHQTYLEWCRQQQEIIDDFIRNRQAIDSV